MGYSNKRKNTINGEKTVDSIEVLRKKSQMTAKGEFEYRKLCQSFEGLLNCKIDASDEGLTFTYDIHEVKEWSCILNEKKELQMLALIDIKKILHAAEQYSFVLTPENLYYDIHGRVYVRDRDIYEKDKVFDEEQFCKQYIALIGCTFLKKYKFEDYYEGGRDLLIEDNFLKEVAKCQTTEEVITVLSVEYERYKKLHQNEYVEVVKKHYNFQKQAFVILGGIALITLAICIYIAVWEGPYEKAVITANEAYLRSDYEATLEAMDKVDVARMNIYQKYILAISSVKCENFSDKNQMNILSNISLNGDEKVMEYWIYINRLDTQNAQDIAMQLSSDQLLYYAYLKEKVVVENDRTLTGEEKQNRLSEIESALSPLKDEYSTLTGE